MAEQSQKLRLHLLWAHEMGKKSRAKRERHPEWFRGRITSLNALRALLRFELRHSDNSCPTEADLRCGTWFKKIEKDADGNITMKHIHYRDVMKKDYEVQTRTHNGPDGETVTTKFWVHPNRQGKSIFGGGVFFKELVKGYLEDVYKELPWLRAIHDMPDLKRY